MEREKLPYCDGYYPANLADQVMDGYEKQIKRLEDDIESLNRIIVLKNRDIQEFKDKVQVLITENNVLKNKLRQAESCLIKWSK